MGSLTETCNTQGLQLGRQEQDEFAARSHQRAAEAQKNGVFDDEIVPTSIPQRKGDDLVVGTDAGVRGDTTAESMSKLRPTFAQDGTITAGPARQSCECADDMMVRSKPEA